ncbi:MAG: molybdate ABC transporter substrate-binding protein [Polynucleobacter sp. 32-46-5]|nr:MAG: molybdate ABC transporter substrate-binding protein [Polynucleobacter sp. 32-46-5]
MGRIVFIAKNSSRIELSKDKTQLASAITKANKIAIAKPELAPYGRAAIEFMKAEGLWDLAKDKLVYGDNIGAATMFVATGAADVGFTALSLAQSPEIAKQTNYVLVNDKLYEPIMQRMVLIKGAPQEAIDLYRFMQSAKAREILVKYGYGAPL